MAQIYATGTLRAAEGPADDSRSGFAVNPRANVCAPLLTPQTLRKSGFGGSHVAQSSPNSAICIRIFLQYKPKSVPGLCERARRFAESPFPDTKAMARLEVCSSSRVDKRQMARKLPLTFSLCESPDASVPIKIYTLRVSCRVLIPLSKL